MTTRPGPHLGMPTDRERKTAAALHAECAGKPVVRVTSAYLAKPGPAWRTVHLEPGAKNCTRESTGPVKDKKHPPEPRDPETGIRAYYVRRARKIAEADLLAFLANGAVSRADFLARFAIDEHSLCAMAKIGRVVLGRRKGKGGATHRGCCVGYVALPGQVVAA